MRDLPRAVQTAIVLIRLLGTSLTRIDHFDIITVQKFVCRRWRDEE